MCPLVEVDARALRELLRLNSPYYALVPGAAGRVLVADLEPVMSVEKSVAARWQRVRGCTNDIEVRNLSLALARKSQRFVSPDHFVSSVAPLQPRMLDKHDRDSSEGDALRSLREMRVRAAPAWDAAEVDLMFRFIREEGAPTHQCQSWAGHCKASLKRIVPSDRFVKVGRKALALDDLTARDYPESDPLDLDHLSRQPG